MSGRRPLASGRDLYRLGVIAAAPLIGRLPSRVGVDRVLPALAILTDRLQPAARARAASALERALGPGSGGRVRAVVRAAYAQLWLDFMALFHPPSTSSLQVRLEGLERLEAALAAGAGAILASSSGYGVHYLARRALAGAGVSLVQVHGPEHFGGRDSQLADRVLAPLHDRSERRWVETLVRIPGDGSFGFTRTLVSALAANRAVIISGDGQEAEGLVEIPFLGTSRRFATGLHSLGRLRRAPVLPLFAVASGGMIEIEIEEQIPPDEGDKARLAAAFAARLERRIRARPGAYLDWSRLAGGAG